MDTITNIVGQRLRAHRQRLDLTQEDLAERAELHATYIGQVERGEKNVTLISLEKILSALKISFSGFFECIESDCHTPNLAMRCYDLVNKMSPREQAHIYRVLCEIEKLMDP